MKVEEVISRVAELCRQHDAQKVILYGSRAKGTALERSDSVDLLNLDTCRNDLLLEDIRQYGRKI